jgi:hypothetical protein
VARMAPIVWKSTSYPCRPHIINGVNNAFKCRNSPTGQAGSIDGNGQWRGLCFRKNEDPSPNGGFFPDPLEQPFIS